ncbi:MAG TPA: hypothetical protein VFP70_04045 [Burkholderiales bacterium]|nr:hypothetical protein [Burkholderiales bacterium]
MNWRRGLVKLALAAAFFVAFLESVTVTAEWWQGTRAMQARDWLWVAALPVLVGIYLRYFSVLRPDCERCAPPPDDLPRRTT